MEKKSKYESKPTAADGNVYYSSEEQNTWSFLLERQNRAIQGRACEEFLHGVKKFVVKLLKEKKQACVRARARIYIAI